MSIGYILFISYEWGDFFYTKLSDQGLGRPTVRLRPDQRAGKGRNNILNCLGKFVTAHFLTIFRVWKTHVFSPFPLRTITLCAYDEIVKVLDDILHKSATTRSNTSGSTAGAPSIWLPTTCNYAIASRVPEERRLQATSPCALRKAIKNSAEIEGARRCQLRDGVALARFYTWLDRSVPGGRVTELSAAAKLLEFRRSQRNYVSLSFETISASDANGAVIHYAPTEESNRPVTADSLFLLDNGSQYYDGTTDITRTYHMGTPSERQRLAFTRVLQGHIALASVRFPNRTTGMARNFCDWND